MMLQKCQECGFLPFDGKSDTDNSMVNVFSGSVKVKVKAKVKLNMVRVTSNHSMVNVSAESESSFLNCRGNPGLPKEGRSI